MPTVFPRIEARKKEKIWKAGYLDRPIVEAESQPTCRSGLAAPLYSVTRNDESPIPRCREVAGLGKLILIMNNHANLRWVFALSALGHDQAQHLFPYRYLGTFHSARLCLLAACRVFRVCPKIAWYRALHAGLPTHSMLQARCGLAHPISAFANQPSFRLQLLGVRSPLLPFLAAPYTCMHSLIRPAYSPDPSHFPPASCPLLPHLFPFPSCLLDSPCAQSVLQTRTP